MATLAIVGAGFCGTMVATHVLRGAPHGIDRILLVERNGRDVGGVAYGTSSTSHTLNVPAGRMSAFEDEPDDFLRFVRARDPALTGGAFVPRRLYGEYLAHTLEAARRDSPVKLIRVAGEAVAAVERADRVTLGLGDGRVLDAEQVVLAVGNYPPSDPPAIDEVALPQHPLRDATPGRPTPSRPSGTSRCSCWGRGSRCATSRSRFAMPISAARSLRSRGEGSCPSRTVSRPRRRRTSIRRRRWTRGSRPRPACSAACVTRCVAWPEPGSTGGRSSRRSVTTPRRSGNASTTRNDAASSAICGRTGRRTGIARLPRPPSRSKRWSARARCGCSAVASSATRRRLRASR